MLREKVPEGPARWICVGLYWVLPNLKRLDLKAQVVHGVAMPDGYVGFAAIYGLGYAAVIVALACWAFSRKEFN